ncbi:hypothetical protein JCM30237_10100 [Halolamina litorea]|uniref:Uncharacterized protein n=1 Tax=Halolamina litorea TaxID=1515593 RepID=A0ABD6BVY1_9EURY|nr:hypothetical protein [Halolamina litorea]
MLLQTVSRGWKLGLLLFVLVGVGLVSYWVYRDADARGMADAPYWGAAVGVASVIGVIVGGVVAVGVYLSARPDEYVGGERPFDAFGDATGAGDQSGADPAHDDLPPVPELSTERVENASETTLRGYARRYDRLDATGDPETIRAALSALVAAGATDELGETVEEADASERPTGGPGPAGVDRWHHAGRPPVRSDSAGADTDADAAAGDGPAREFEWVEEA